MGQCLGLAATSRETVILVGDGDDARANGDEEAEQAVGIAAAVEPLVVVSNHGSRQGQELKRLYQLRTDPGVVGEKDGLHPRLAVGGTELADVMQQPGLTNNLGVPLRKSYCERETVAERCYPSGVPAGDGLAPLSFGCSHKGLQDGHDPALPLIPVVWRTVDARRWVVPGDLQPPIGTRHCVKGTRDREHHDYHQCDPNAKVDVMCRETLGVLEPRQPTRATSRCPLHWAPLTHHWSVAQGQAIMAADALRDRSLSRSLSTPQGRRAFIASILASLGTAVAAPPANAQQTPNALRLGWLSPGAASTGTPNLDALREGLRELGYQEGRNLTIETRWAGGASERLSALAQELVRLRVDIICTAGTQASRAAREATSTIPVVFANVAFPVEQQLVLSFARPGGNVTGVAFIGPEYGKRLELLKEVLPRLSRVALIYNPDNQGSVLALGETKRWAERLGIAVQPQRLRGPHDIDETFKLIAGGRPDAIMTTADPLIASYRMRIVEFATKHRFPSMYPGKEYVDAGGSRGRARWRTGPAAPAASGVFRGRSRREVHRSVSRPRSSNRT